MYIYAEATQPRYPGDKASISMWRGPSTSCMRFYYHMYGAMMGELRVITVDSKRKSTKVWEKQGSQGNQWMEGGLTLHSSLSYQVRSSGI